MAILMYSMTIVVIVWHYAVVVKVVHYWFGGFSLPLGFGWNGLGYQGMRRLGSGIKYLGMYSRAFLSLSFVFPRTQHQSFYPDSSLGFVPIKYMMWEYLLVQ